MAKRHHSPKPDPKLDSDLQARLGAVIRTCRRQLGITQEEFAWRANMHRTYIADVERGARNVTLRSVTNLAKALQVTVGNLFSYATEAVGSDTRIGADTDAGRAREILLVEDNETDAALTQRAFKRARVTNPLRVVYDAESGLEYLRGTGRYAKRKPPPPQLILLDLYLPEMSGLEFLRRVKGSESTRDIPVVILTGSKSDRLVLECSRLGAEHYIVKPFGVEGLIEVTPKLNLHLTLGPPPTVPHAVGAAD